MIQTEKNYISRQIFQIIMLSICVVLLWVGLFVSGKLYGSFCNSEMIYKPAKAIEILIYIVSTIALYGCFGSGFSDMTALPVVGDASVRLFVYKRELLHMFRATIAIGLNTFFDIRGFIYLVVTIGGYIILKAIVHILLILFSDTYLSGYVDVCHNFVTREEGSDVDSATLVHEISTTKEQIVFYGYGAVVNFVSSLKKRDRILILRLGQSSRPYMICKLTQTSDLNLKKIKYRTWGSKDWRLLVVLSLLLVWIILPRIV